MNEPPSSLGEIEMEEAAREQDQSTASSRDPFLDWFYSIDTSNYSHSRDLCEEAWNASAAYYTGTP